MADLQRKTANLFDWKWLVDGYHLSPQTGLPVDNARRTSILQPIDVALFGRLYLSFIGVDNDNVKAMYSVLTNDDTLVRRVTNISSGDFLDVSGGNKLYIAFYDGSSATTTLTKDNVGNVMLNTGSTPLPYEPYGWVHSLRKLGTSTDTITTLPADVYTDGTNATVGLVGNMSQTSTPTPTTPIQPQECGDRTENLFDKDNTTIYNAYITDNGSWLSADDSSSIKIPCEPNTEYIISVPNALVVFRLYEYYDATVTPPTSGVTLSRIIRGTNISEYTFTTSATSNVLIFQGPRSMVTEWFNGLMLNLGSTALPYEPYGYKLTISSANTTTPVYLGEVESTRRIKKLVLTGDEPWQLHSSVANLFRFDINDYLFSQTNISICSHYKSIANTGATGVSNGETCFYYGSSTARIIYIKDGNISTEADFKAYLAQQYAAGTPVTVWYILATETTTTVNEPLREIGDYADTVSGITIPTITGKDTFDVLTNLKPSEVELTYTGWHNATVKEKSENLFSTEGAKEGYYIDQSGAERISSYPDYEFSYTKLLPVEPNTICTFSVNVPQHTYARTNRRIHGYDANGNWIEQIDNLVITDTDVGVLSLTFTTPSTCQYVTINYLNNNNANGDIWLMLNTGSTALPYEPYWK